MSDRKVGMCVCVCASLFVVVACLSSEYIVFIVTNRSFVQGPGSVVSVNIPWTDVQREAK